MVDKISQDIINQKDIIKHFFFFFLIWCKTLCQNHSTSPTVTCNIPKKIVHLWTKYWRNGCDLKLNLPHAMNFNLPIKTIVIKDVVIINNNNFIINHLLDNSISSRKKIDFMVLMTWQAIDFWDHLSHVIQWHNSGLSFDHHTV